MKTYKQWTEARVSFTEFAAIGDEVDEEIAEYFIETLPPVTWNSEMIQMGEPYDHNGKNGRARYLTLEKIDGKWFYTGKKVKEGV